MKKINLGGMEVRDYENSPILMCVTFDKSVVWTHLHPEIDRISPRRFKTKHDARKYAFALGELLKRFVDDAEKLIVNYSGGETIETTQTTIIDIDDRRRA